MRQPPQAKCTSKFHRKHFIRKFTRKCRTPEPKTTLCANLRSRNALPFHKNIQEKCRAPSQPRTQTLTLCQRAQSKCMSTLHKNHFILKFAGKMSQTRTLREPAKSKCMSTLRTLAQSECLRSGLTWGAAFFLYIFVKRKMPRPKSAQNANTHFVPACAVEMHVNIAQGPLYTEIGRKNVADTHFV